VLGVGALVAVAGVLGSTVSVPPTTKSAASTFVLGFGSER
jgi:hypothetical protein